MLILSHKRESVYGYNRQKSGAKKEAYSTWPSGGERENLRAQSHLRNFETKPIYVLFPQLGPSSRIGVRKDIAIWRVR